MDNTIFDDVFRTILERMPELVIPVINEVFNTDYPYDARVEQHRNEHHTKDGEVITDSCLSIGRKTYHIECQSKPDGTMVIRMIEYDFLVALENAQKGEEGEYQMEFPHSCVLYLRHNRNTPDVMRMRVRLPDGSGFWYQMPVVKVQEYTKDEIFQKKLLMFLPFYIMRYEKRFKEIGKDEEKLGKLLHEYGEIQKGLEEEFTEQGRYVAYIQLRDLIMRIKDYMLKSEEKIRKGLGEVMGGKVLELEIDKALDAAMRQGIDQGIKQGLEQGSEVIILSMYKKGYILEEIADVAEKTVEEIRAIIEKRTLAVE